MNVASNSGVVTAHILVENEAVKGRILLDKKGLQLTGFGEKTDGFGNTYYQPVFEEK